MYLQPHREPALHLVIGAGFFVLSMLVPAAGWGLIAGSVALMFHPRISIEKPCMETEGLEGVGKHAMGMAYYALWAPLLTIRAWWRG